MKCKHCGNPLVTSLSGDNRCGWCGRRAGMMRAAFSTSTLTKKGARKVALREHAKRVAKQREAIREYVGRPPPPGESMSWEQAEVLVRDWMRKNGYRDAALTPQGADGGVDITSWKAIAQVKHQIKPVGLPAIQRTYGIALTTRRKALFFSSSGYTPKAREWARQHGVVLHVYPPVRRL